MTNYFRRRQKHLNYILIFLLLVSCSTTKKLTQRNSKPTRFVFTKQLVITKNGIQNFHKKVDSLLPTKNLNSSTPKAQYDSISNSPEFKKIMRENIKKSLLESPTEQVIIEIINDTIWRHTKRKEKMIGDYFMIQKKSGILNYYNKSKSVNHKKYDLFSQKYEYEISENRKDRKEIKGYDCFKLTIIKFNKESDLGNTTYEMYVTNKINLPIHTVINLTKLVPNTFPMEIKISEEKLSGMTEFYKLIKIE